MIGVGLGAILATTAKARGPRDSLRDWRYVFAADCVTAKQKLYKFMTSR